MNKKVWLGCIAVFVTLVVLDIIINGVILNSEWKENSNLFRPDMESKMWIFWLMDLIGAFFFSFIFSKGYENKGIAEGVRYGLYIGIWMSVGMAYGTYTMIAIPYSLALHWFLLGVAEFVIAGIVLALVFKPKAKGPAAA